jgi:Calx-beta domain/FG-GAP-like repeat
LSGFDGQNPNGVWNLNVSDNAAVDTGSLRRFSLIITDAGAILPSLSINDVSVTEGNAGTTNANFTVTLSAASTTAVTVNYATADQTATAPGDYTATNGTLTFAPGETTKPVTVLVNGDTNFELNETFAVNLSSVSSNATILDNQGIGTITNDDVSTSPNCVFNNGGLNPQATAENGAAAPTGFFWSEVQHDAGNTTVSNTNAGIAPNQGSFRLADNFTVPTGGCTLNTVTFFAYQTGAAASPSPFAAYTLQIWNGRPGDAGATVIFGDTTTNRLASSVDSTLFRIFNTVVPTPTAPGTTRKIWRNTLNVGTVLPAGTYWLDWASTATNGAAHFQPTKTIPGARGAAGDNARQLTVASGVWADVTDAGNPASTPLVPQDFPFYLNSLTVNNAPVDFNGDGKTDFVVTRNIGVSTSGATNQLRWYYNLNGSGGTVATDWGISTDNLTPVDFDGDGKDDIAVWRSDVANVAAFYILQSGTNTLRIDTFGQTGDDPSVVGDYDGDGKADPAVYRAGATGAQSTWYYRGSFNNPSGNITPMPWGIGGDLPTPGDYDGDGKMDLNVKRDDATGQALFILRKSGDASVTYTHFGIPTDSTVPGDYDGDGKTDLAIRRTTGGVHNYAILQSSNATIRYVQFGATGFRTVQGDYDGDGKTDIASWQPATGTFWVIQSSNGVTAAFQLGSNGDEPAADYNTH